MAGYSRPDPADGGLRRQVLGAVVALILAGIAFSLPDPAKEEFSAVLRNTALAPFIGINGAIQDVRVRARDTEALRAVADSLSGELLARSTLEEENRRLRDLLLLSERLGPEWLPAEAIRPGTQGSESILLLDVGGQDGIRERAPLVTREGLAGVVRERRGSQAVAMDWTHPEFAAGAMSEDGLTYGIVEVRRGAFREEDRLVLQGTPFNTDLAPGTVIVTSGLGGIFPRGIPIGRVERVDSTESTFQKSYDVIPYVDPGSITLVLVQQRVTLEADSAEALRPGALGAWPREEVMRAEERARLVPVWQDSLLLLRDSLARLSPGGSR